MTTVLPTSVLRERRVIRALSLRGLIRLITEIDDNGPISRQRGSLQGALSDLTNGQLRHAIDTARDLGLIHARGHALARYQLTASGKDLAEVYDTAANWARTNQVPGRTSDFVARVQHAFQMQDGDPGQSGAATEPSAPRPALSEWLTAYPRVLHQDITRSSCAAEESGRAA
jgi:DNA-binding HxlR family transcriptional regulator